MATWCKGLTHLKTPWCQERLKAGGEGDNRGQDGWIALPTQWTWVEQTLGDGEGQGSLACYSPWESQRAGHDKGTKQKQTQLFIAHSEPDPLLYPLHISPLIQSSWQSDDTFLVYLFWSWGNQGLKEIRWFHNSTFSMIRLYYFKLRKCVDYYIFFIYLFLLAK